MAGVGRKGKGFGANGEGSVYQRKQDGRWIAALSVRDEAGKSRRRVSYHRSREDADAALVEMKAARNKGVEHHTGLSPKLEDFLVSWLRDSIAVSVGPKTLEGYEVACRVHIIPELGGVRLRDLKPRQIQSLHAAKHRAGLSIRTRRNIHDTLKRALRQAVAWGELDLEPGRYARSAEGRGRGRRGLRGDQGPDGPRGPEAVRSSSGVRRSLP